MLQLFVEHPWLALCAMVSLVVVACVAIVFITDYLRRTHQAEIDAALKQDMLNRGMSAADIKTVFGSDCRWRGCAARIIWKPGSSSGARQVPSRGWRHDTARARSERSSRGAFLGLNAWMHQKHCRLLAPRATKGCLSKGS